MPEKQVTTLAQKKRAETLTAFAFMAPALLIFTIFLIIPIGFAIFFSLTDWDGIRPLGQQEVRATGEVTFTNQTDEPIVIPAGTELQGRDLGIFQTTEAVTLPPVGEELAEVAVEPLEAPGRLTIDVADIPPLIYNVGRRDEALREQLTPLIEAEDPSTRDFQAALDQLLAQVEVANVDELDLGFAVLVNNTSQEITIPEGMRVNRLEAITYLTTEEVTVSAGEGSTVQATVTATEDRPGRLGNITRERINEVPESLEGQVTVINERAIANGVDRDFNFVGLQNYDTLLFEDGIRRQDFFTALKNTTYFVLGVVPLQTTIALILAVILNQRYLRGRGLFRTAFYFPSITSSVVISIIFMWMFTRGGLVNTILGTSVNWLNDSNGVIHNILGVLGITRATVGGWADTQLAGLSLWDWISGPSVTMFTIMLLNTWTTIGTMMVIYLAALQNIPTSVYEAAQIDGATAGQIFRRITVPLLAPTTFFVVTLGLIGTFQVFDQIYVISSGGPAKTTLTIAYIVYQNGFNNSQMGLAAATAIILFVIIFAFTIVQRRITRETANV
ncbi:MAG: ABC transporter permease subunit [Chloroflexota bacterium]